MKRHKLMVAFYLLCVSSILFSCISTYSQEQAKNAAEKEQAEKSFKTIQEVWTTPLKNQGYTSTCWAFSTTSFLESEAHRLGMGDFEISQMHTVYYAYLEKAQRHILSHTENPFGPGGHFHDVIYLIGKYGAVPRKEYLGNMNIDNIYDDREMFKALSGMLSGVSDAGKEDIPLSGQIIDGQFNWYWLTGFKSALDAYLGKPPDSIMYNNKRISPKKYADEVLNLPLNDYIEITSLSQFPFYSVNEFLLPDNWLHYNKFYNVPLEDFMRIIDHSLANGFSLCLAYDGTLDLVKSKTDYLLGLDEEKDPEMTQKKRDMMFLSWRTFDDHAVHLIGTALDEMGAKFYKVKDSATPKDEDVTIFYNKEYLSENFVKSRVLFFMVNKNALPTDISVKLGFK